ncbi:enhancer of polycomb homolog 1 [Anabrus simplex]|uniref:enhancer of polycomb homolog 1 n=1 Tax=Anabrus simplex TaxID=316456 RepID=UPI0034DDBECF
MSKLSFRARALDASKPMPIYMSEELPDLPDYSAINRAVPQMPSGMEKEEECEHHLQRAICTGLIIPTPEVTDLTDMEAYDRLYPVDYKLPRQLIHMQPFAMEQDIPDYDMDSEDEQWISAQSSKLEITPLKFEEMMDRLEKGSGQTVVTMQEAKSLLKDDDDLIIAVYDYWLNKRLKTQHPLIPAVKTEHRLGSVANNPYVAFRRRTEKMQTRKNRKNDETSYEKMLKLRRDLSRAVTLLELVKRREKSKRELLHLTIEVYEKRYQANDFSGQLLAEVSALKATRPAFTPLFTNQFGVNHQTWPNKVSSKDEVAPRKEKRQYKKRKHKASVGATTVGSHGHHGGRGSTAHPGSSLDLLGYGSGEIPSSEEEVESAVATQASEEDEADSVDGLFAFRRKKFCNYHAPLPKEMGNWPWCSREEGGLADRRYRYCLTSIATPQRKCVGFARRRIGRGGRVILDRAATSMDDIFSSFDFTVLDNSNKDQFLTEVKNEWLHFRPKSPPPPITIDDDDSAIVDLTSSARDDAWLNGLPADPSSISLNVEAVPGDGVFSDNTGIMEHNLADLLANSSTEEDQMLFDQLGDSDFAQDSETDRLGFEHLDSSDSLYIGSSRFLVHPSSTGKSSRNSWDRLQKSSDSWDGVRNIVPSTSNCQTLPAGHLQSINNRRKHRHCRWPPVLSSLATSTSTVSTNTTSNVNSVVSNGGLVVVKREPSTSGCETTSVVNALGLIGTGSAGLQGLTNGPASVSEYTGSTGLPRSAVAPVGSRSGQFNCLPSGPSAVPPPPLLLATQFRAHAPHNMKLPSQATATLPVLHIKQEPPDDLPPFSRICT